MDKFNQDLIDKGKVHIKDLREMASNLPDCMKTRGMVAHVDAIHIRWKALEMYLNKNLT